MCNVWHSVEYIHILITLCLWSRTMSNVWHSVEYTHNLITLCLRLYHIYTDDLLKSHISCFYYLCIHTRARRTLLTKKRFLLVVFNSIRRRQFNELIRDRQVLYWRRLRWDCFDRLFLTEPTGSSFVLAPPCLTPYGEGLGRVLSWFEKLNHKIQL